MDFLSNLAKKATSEGPKHNTHSPAPDHKPANSDLARSAKIVAESAQAQFRHEKFDKKKTAGATADLLRAAESYGKLDESKGVGKYVDQAEHYLRKYCDGTSKPAEHKTEGRGSGDLMKMAGDFMKK